MGGPCKDPAIYYSVTHIEHPPVSCVSLLADVYGIYADL